MLTIAAPAVTHRTVPGWVRDLGAIALVALVVVLCFWRVFFVPGYWVPEGGGDLASTMLPFYRFAAEELRRGSIPLWNPYLYGGAPFAADLQTAVFYPINWVLFFGLPEITYASLQYLALFHIALAGAGMYLLGVYNGELPVSRPAALAGAITYSLCDYFIVHLGNLNLVAGAAWLPFVALGMARGVASRRWLPFAGAGVALAMMVLAGHIQPFLYGMLFAAGYALFGIIRAGRIAPGLAARALIVPLIALGLAAIQLIPGVELRAYTARAAIGYDVSIEYSLPPVQLLSLIVPDLFGRGPGSYWAPWPRVEMGYFGILPIVAVATAIALFRRPLTWFLIAVMVVGLLMAFGGYTVLHGLLYQFVPGFAGLRAPARAIILFNLAASWLTMIGLDAAIRGATLGRVVRWGLVILVVAALGLLPAVVVYLSLVAGTPGPAAIRVAPIANGLVVSAALLAATLALFAARPRLGPWLFGALAVLIVVFDMLTTQFDVEGGGDDPSANYRRDAVVAFLKQQPPARIDTETGVWDVWQPAAGLYHRIPDVRGVDNPLMLADTQRYWAELGGRNGAPYDLLGVGYVLGHKNIRLEPGKFVKVFDDDPEIAVYRNTTALPRAWLVPEGRTATQAEAFTAIRASGFSPRSVAYIEGPSVTGGSGAVTIDRWDAGFQRLRVTAPAGGLLAIGETWYPGWEATVNGVNTAIARTNAQFRGVAVPAGESIVDLAYRPRSFATGALVTIGTIVVCAAAIVVTSVAAARR